MVVAVCGSRKNADPESIHKTLDAFHLTKPITKLLHGEASGVDTVAKEWAIDREIECIGFPANWSYYGSSAGPIRNRKMLKEGGVELLIAFPGGAGTDNCKKTATKLGVQVVTIEA